MQNTNKSEQTKAVSGFLFRRKKKKKEERERERDVNIQKTGKMDDANKKNGGNHGCLYACTLHEILFTL
jgi:hypothetical protein